ncbi:hypothetical protein HZA44_00695 [Candidatus Peregrinibacteria bacterium]|nr:hypothetical protein [Candidatus Peregrinibacteria bacterium]
MLYDFQGKFTGFGWKEKRLVFANPEGLNIESVKHIGEPISYPETPQPEKVEAPLTEEAVKPQESKPLSPESTDGKKPVEITKAPEVAERPKAKLGKLRSSVEKGLVEKRNKIDSELMPLLGFGSTPNEKGAYTRIEHPDDKANARYEAYKKQFFELSPADQRSYAAVTRFHEKFLAGLKPETKPKEVVSAPSDQSTLESSTFERYLGLFRDAATSARVDVDTSSPSFRSDFALAIPLLEKEYPNQSLSYSKWREVLRKATLPPIPAEVAVAPDVSEMLASKQVAEAYKAILEPKLKEVRGDADRQSKDLFNALAQYQGELPDRAVETAPLNVFKYLPDQKSEFKPIKEAYNTYVAGLDAWKAKKDALKESNAKVDRELTPSAELVRTRDALRIEEATLSTSRLDALKRLNQSIRDFKATEARALEAMEPVLRQKVAQLALENPLPETVNVKDVVDPWTFSNDKNEAKILIHDFFAKRKFPEGSMPTEKFNLSAFLANYFEKRPRAPFGGKDSILSNVKPVFKEKFESLFSGASESEMTAVVNALVNLNNMIGFEEGLSGLSDSFDTILDGERKKAQLAPITPGPAIASR